MTYPFRDASRSLHHLAPVANSTLSRQLGSTAGVDVLSVALALTSPGPLAGLPSQLAQAHVSWLFFLLFTCPFIHSSVKHRSWASQNKTHTAAESVCLPSPQEHRLSLSISERVELWPHFTCVSGPVLGDVKAAQGRVLTLQNHVVLLRVPIKPAHTKLELTCASVLVMS